MVQGRNKFLANVSEGIRKFSRKVKFCFAPRRVLEASSNKSSNPHSKNNAGLIDRLIEFTKFTLPLKAWHKSRDIISSIVLASLLVNLLALIFPLMLLQIYRRIIPNQAIDTLVWMVLIVFVSLFLIMVLRILRSYIGAWADSKFEHVIGCEAFNRIMQCNLLEYEKEGAGKHLKRLNALNVMRDFYAGQVITAIVDVPFVIVFLLMIGYLAGWLVVIPVVMIITLLYTTIKNSTRVSEVLTVRQEHDNRRLNFIVEMLSKIHTIKSNTMEAQMLRRFERLQKQSSVYDYKVSRRGSSMLSQSMTLSQASLAAVVGCGAMLVFNGHLTVGELAAVTLLTGRTLQPVSTIISLWSRMQLIKIAREEFQKVLSMKIETSPSLEKVEKVDGKIEFQHVSFSYDSHGEKLVHDCSIKIPAKRTITIKGSGISGKSTLFSLILNLVKPNSGKILIDNKDIQTLEPYSMREFIGLMPQTAVLFQGSIIDNITMFRPELEEDAMNICEKVGLATVIHHLPDGFDTLVGQNTVGNLARGVAQRLVIARALVRNPPILLFDEANIALDMQSDAKIRELLESLKGEHTIILMSHRPSFLSLSEHQYVFVDGKLKEL